MLGVTCDNASANDAMVEHLAAIILDFPGDANRARCLAHIVNLVVKIILRQFDMSKKKGKKDVPNNSNGDNPREVDGEDDEMSEEDIDELLRGLDKEEKEMDEGDDEDDEESEKILRDVEEIEKVLEEDIKEVLTLAKPVRQVLFKVSLCFFFPQSPSPFFFSIPVPLLFFLDPRPPFFFFSRSPSPFFFFLDPRLSSFFPRSLSPFLLSPFFFSSFLFFSIPAFFFFSVASFFISI
jgi:hypothetical protein